MERRKTDMVLAWKNKSESANKTETIKEIHKLSLQIQAMEREKGTHIYSKRNEFRKDFSQFEETEDKLTAERKTEQVHVRQQLDKINHMVKHFRRELRDVKPTPEFVERLKVIMEDVESTINTFKEQQRSKFEDLLHDEQTCIQELQSLERRFDSWNKLPSCQSVNEQPSSLSGHKPLASARDVIKDLPPEVAAFERFLQQTGGHRGGWDEYDHQTFLKFRNKYKGKSIFMTHVHPSLPTRIEGEIRSHENWYQEYMTLNDNKRHAIQKWREKKEEDKESALSHRDGREDDGSDDDEHARQQRIQEQKEVEKHDRFKHLNAWKVEKELERVQKEEKSLQEQVMLRRKHQEQRLKQLETKMKVEEYHRQREEDEAFLEEQDNLWEQEQLERKRQLSAREIARFKSRDQQKFDEKQEKKRLEETEVEEKNKRKARMKEQVESTVRRDPCRLYQATAGWNERLKDSDTSDGRPLLKIPHRAVPNWRQGML